MDNRTFKKYWNSLSVEEKKELAIKADTSYAYLSQVASGHRNAGWKTIKNLNSADKNIDFSMFDVTTI